MISDGVLQDHHFMDRVSSNPAPVYTELRQLAAAYLRDERPAHTLQPTALVNEAVLRLLSSGEAEGMEARALIRAAARAMRHVLVDHARRRNAAKRNGSLAREELREDMVLGTVRGLDMMALDEALVRLGELDPELLQIVELRFFGGLTEEQAARCLGVSPRTITRAWRFARLWLAHELSAGDAA
jgi:RNA polymerase sigma-70 factor (ECF subfamily)